MIRLMILSLLLITSISASKPPQTDKDRTEEYERCARYIKCEHDDKQSLDGLDEETRKKVLKCRLDRLVKCSHPEEEENVQKNLNLYYPNQFNKH